MLEMIDASEVVGAQGEPAREGTSMVWLRDMMKDTKTQKRL